MEADPRDLLIEQLKAENAELREKLKQTLERLAELERGAYRQAGPFRREEKKKVPPPERKRPGRKPGHEGFFRQTPEQIDQVIDVPLKHCPVCGGAVSGVVEIEQIIEEIPPVKPVAVKLTTRRGHCCKCGKDVRSTHPLQSSDAGGCAKVQVGPRALSLAMMLNKSFGLTMRKTVAVLERLCGLRITPGGLSQMMDRLAARLGRDYQRLMKSLRRQRAVFSDETSWWVGGPGQWLWTFTCANLTVYRVEPNRSGDVVIDTLGENFKGVLVSDCLSSYNRIDCKKQKCIAHHQRAINAALENGASDYLLQWKNLFKTASTLWRIRKQLPLDQWKRARDDLEKTKDKLLDHPGQNIGDAKICNRLIKHREHLLRCLEEPRAEPTNNRAERSLRPAVIARKVSCGNKTENGKQTWQVLASIAATCNQRGEDLLEFIRPRLALNEIAG